MKCRDCKCNGFLSEDGNQFNWCFQFDDNLDIDEERQCSGFVPASNADRIRAMTDEELADFINDTEYGFIDRPGMCDVCTQHRIQNCKQCWLDWLKQEAHNDP